MQCLSDRHLVILYHSLLVYANAIILADAVQQGHRGLAVHDLGLLLDGFVLNLAMADPKWV